jgi:hypothetical protein
VVCLLANKAESPREVGGYRCRRNAALEASGKHPAIIKRGAEQTKALNGRMLEALASEQDLCP